MFNFHVFAYSVLIMSRNMHSLFIMIHVFISLVRPDPETRLNPTRTRPRPRFGCTRPKIYTRRVGQVLNSRPGSGSGCPPGRQVLGLACLPTRLYTRLTQFYTRYLHEY